MLRLGSGECRVLYAYAQSALMSGSVAGKLRCLPLRINQMQFNSKEGMETMIQQIISFKTYRPPPEKEGDGADLGVSWDEKIVFDYCNIKYKA